MFSLLLTEPHPTLLQIGTFQLSFSGGSMDWLLNLFSPLIEEIISNALRGSFPTILQDVIKAANTLMEQVRTVTQVHVFFLACDWFSPYGDLIQ